MNDDEFDPHQQDDEEDNFEIEEHQVEQELQNDVDGVPLVGSEDENQEEELERPLRQKPGPEFYGSN